MALFKSKLKNLLLKIEANKTKIKINNESMKFNFNSNDTVLLFLDLAI